MKNILKKISIIALLCCVFVSPELRELQPMIEHKAEKVIISKSLIKERDCIVEALYHEARGESLRGIKAVATVIYNRKHSDKFEADTYCKIIRAPKQFSYRNKVSLHTNIPISWKKIEESKKELILSIADKLVLKTFKPIVSQEILWYHTKSVNPSWNRKLKSISIDNHLFFYES